MNETAGRTFSIADENPAAEGCTISRAIEDSNGNAIKEAILYYKLINRM